MVPDGEGGAGSHPCGTAVAGSTHETGARALARDQKDKRMRWLDGITDSADMSLSREGEMLKDREACRAAVHGVVKSRTRLSD